MALINCIVLCRLLQFALYIYMYHYIIIGTNNYLSFGWFIDTHHINSITDRFQVVLYTFRNTSGNYLLKCVLKGSFRCLSYTSLVCESVLLFKRQWRCDYNAEQANMLCIYVITHIHIQKLYCFHCKAPESELDIELEDSEYIFSDSMTDNLLNNAN